MIHELFSADRRGSGPRIVFFQPYCLLPEGHLCDPLVRSEDPKLYKKLASSCPIASLVMIFINPSAYHRV